LPAGLLELFDGQSASDSMLRLVAGTVLLFLMGLTEALAVEETKRSDCGVGGMYENAVGRA
jgi:hypothetical protein